MVFEMTDTSSPFNKRPNAALTSVACATIGMASDSGVLYVTRSCSSKPSTVLPRLIVAPDSSGLLESVTDDLTGSITVTGSIRGKKVVW